MRCRIALELLDPRVVLGGPFGGASVVPKELTLGPGQEKNEDRSRQWPGEERRDHIEHERIASNIHFETGNSPL